MSTVSRIITVLQLCEHFGNAQVSFHGVARSFELWLPAFDKRRFRVLLCSRQGPVKSAEERFKAVGIQPLYLGYGRFDPRNLLKLIRVVRREQVDIIHAHGYGACLWGRLAGLLLRRPVIVHERCNYRTVPWYQRPVERLLGPFTRYAFAVSESTRQFTVSQRHIPAAVVRVLYSGIPLEQVKHIGSDRIQALRQALERRPEDKVLGIVGRLESHKGHLDAFRALELMLKERGDVYLWVIGDGRYQETLRRWVTEHGLTGRIAFLGYRADVLELIQCLDVQIFPSHQEGTPNTLYEALAVGNAIVASTADGQGEILEHAKTALLFPPGDAARMAELILSVLRDDQLRASLRRNARERAMDFDMRRTIQTLEETYEQIVVEHGL